MYELVDAYTQNAVIKVIGVGGGGSNAVNHMLEGNIEGVEFVCANTDAQALKNSPVKTLLQLGGAVTKGLGAGANPNIGREAALEDKERIQEALEGTDMVFITAGMGGGTGTGAAPVVAQVAREMGILTVAVVTKPFSFEGNRRMMVANMGIEELAQHVDSLITIPNERLLSVLGKEMSLLNAFKAANDVLLDAVQGIAELITRPGLINVDFADVRTVMTDMGVSMMGTGSSKGENRARVAAEEAINSPLLEDIDIEGAHGILVNITAGLDLSIGEFDEVGNIIKAFAQEDAIVVIGTVVDSDMQDSLRVTVVATGLDKDKNDALEIPQLNSSETPERIIKPTANYNNMEAPTVIRKETVKVAPVVKSKATPVATKTRQRPAPAAATPKPVAPSAGYTDSEAKEKNMDYLDIPAFLRRQAD